MKYRWLDLRREHMQRNIRVARAARPDHPRGDGARGLRRHRDADALEADARGRARLRRPVAAAAGQVLRAAAVAADREAAARHLRLRALLPDRALHARRGSARRPPAGADAARRRDGVPRPRVHLRADGAHRRAHLARVHRRRARGAVPADDLRRGDAPLRHRPARPALRDGDPGGDRGDARLRVRRLRERAVVRYIAVPKELSRTEVQALENQAKSWGAKGLAYLVFRADGEISLADREVPRRGAARALARAGPHAALRRRRRRASSRRCSASCGCSSAASSASSTSRSGSSSGSSTCRPPSGTSRRERWIAAHHPFTRPTDDSIEIFKTDPGAARAVAYDLVGNGIELAGGSFRIHEPWLQQQVFENLGIGAEEQREKFGFLLDALAMGAPPHGGIASGIDRLTMALLDRAVHPRHAGVPEEPGRVTTT